MKQDKIQYLRNRLKETIDEIERELAIRYPIGHEVQVVLSSRQVNPSPGIVYGYNGGSAAVRVTLSNYKEYGRMRSRDIPVNDIIACQRINLREKCSPEDTGINQKS